jgi:Arc/MetJ-type ribon-helix-helix transcriptional regulator
MSNREHPRLSLLDEHALVEIDRLVREGVYANRRKAIEAGVHDRLARSSHSRLARESAKLDRSQEQALANEGHARASEWPEY